MAYRRGDYYGGRGDYYGQGDPGVFSFLGGLAKTALGLIPGPVGAIARLIAHPRTPEIPASPSNFTVPELPPPPMIAPTMFQGAPGTGIITHSPMGTPVSPAAIARQVARLKRSHPNKQTYVIRGGGTSRWGAASQLQVIPKGTTDVPNRRMNVANPRALRRSLRRVAGFAKLTKRVRRAVSMAASAVGVHHRRAKTIRRK